MSRLFDLLQGIITKVNSIKGGGDWSQNAENGPGYIANRTHYKFFAHGDRLIECYGSSDFTIIEQDDGTYAWASDKYIIPVTGTLDASDFGGAPGYTSEDERIESECVVVSSGIFDIDYELPVLVSTRFVSHGDQGYEVILETDKFTITGPYQDQPNWYFIPKEQPDETIVNRIDSEKNSLFTVSRPVVSYSRLSDKYLPDTVLTSQSFYDGDLYYEYFHNNVKPFYTIPYHETLLQSNVGLAVGAASTLAFIMKHDAQLRYRVNGVDYQAKRCKYDDDFHCGEHLYIGNAHLLHSESEDTGEDFVIYQSYDGAHCASIKISDTAITDSGYVQLGDIYEIQPEYIKKIEEEYLPESQITSDEIDRLASMLYA